MPTYLVRTYFLEILINCKRHFNGFCRDGWKIIKNGVKEACEGPHCLLKGGLADTLAGLNPTFFPGT